MHERTRLCKRTIRCGARARQIISETILHKHKPPEMSNTRSVTRAMIEARPNATLRFAALCRFVSRP